MDDSEEAENFFDGDEEKREANDEADIEVRTLDEDIKLLCQMEAGDSTNLAAFLGRGHGTLTRKRLQDMGKFLCLPVAGKSKEAIAIAIRSKSVADARAAAIVAIRREQDLRNEQVAAAAAGGGGAVEDVAMMGGGDAWDWPEFDENSGYVSDSIASGHHTPDKNTIARICALLFQHMRFIDSSDI
jgi:hypothetical protein